MRITILITFLLASSVVKAAPILIDFDEITPQSGSGQITVESKGYSFFAFGSSYSDPWSGVSSAGFYSSGDCFSYGPGCGVTVSMESASGTPFSVHSFTVAYDDNSQNWQAAFTGTVAGGATADLSAAVGTGDWLQLESLLAWSTCLSSSCTEQTVRIDDITVSAVPLPPAVWLLGTSLAALGWFRRH